MHTIFGQFFHSLAEGQKVVAIVDLCSFMYYLSDFRHLNSCFGRCKVGQLCIICATIYAYFFTLEPVLEVGFRYFSRTSEREFKS